MLSAEARIHAERPSRYLVQLCRHAGQMRHIGDRTGGGHDEGAPPEVHDVEWSDTHGIVKMNWGQWTVRADGPMLTVRAESADEEDLLRLQGLLAGRLQKIGRRDHLTVNWQRLTSGSGDIDHADHAVPAERPQPGANARRQTLTRRLLIVAAVTLLVAVHLGLGGAAFANLQWAVWTGIGLVALFLAKAIGLRLLATRRGSPPDVPKGWSVP